LAPGRATCFPQKRRWRVAVDSLSHSPLSDASTKHETAALASIYQMALETYREKKEAAPESRSEDAERRSSEFGDAASISKK
jgi:hypothetical protein